MTELTQPITDQKISTFLGKLKQVWRVNRLMPLGTILHEIKILCDNPYTDVSDMDHTMLEQGADRYLVQERRDHPDRFTKADEESKMETEIVKKEIEEKKNVKLFKDMTPEEQKAWKIENLKKAREAKALKQTLPVVEAKG